MTWNEIQAKWAAMARRVRSDLPQIADDAISAQITPRLLPPLPTNQQVRPPFDHIDT